MSEARIDSLEKGVFNLSVTLGKLETSLESIDNTLKTILGLNNDVVTIKEKVTNLEKGYTLMERRVDKLVWYTVAAGTTVSLILPLIMFLITK